MRKLKVSAPDEVGTPKRAIAAGLSGLVAALTVYLIFHAITGQASLDWRVMAITAGIGAIFGAFLGAGTKTGGLFAGIFAGVWIVFEIIIGIFLMIIEVIIATIAALFS